MAEISTNTNNGSGGLYFIVGGLVVAVAVGAFAYFGGYVGSYSKTTEQTTVAPAADGSTTTTTTTKETTTP